MAFNFGDIPLILQELRRYFASKAQGTLADSALQPGAIGSTVQGYDADLAAVAAITTTGGIKRTGANTWTTFDLTNAGEAVTGAADAAAQRTALGLTIGSNVQAWDADLDAIAAISTTGPIERTGAGTWAVSDRVRLFGGNASEGSYTSTNGSTLDRGVYFYSSFTVQAGHTITVNRFARIFVSGPVVIDGIVNVTPAIESMGFAGIFQSARNDFPGFGIGGTRRNVYNPFIQPYGSTGRPGDGSTALNSAEFNTGLGGDGGGGLWIEATGTISVGSTGQINAIGGAGARLEPLASSNLGGGGGGGSGGVISLSSLVSITLNPSSVISVRGGNGGNGYSGNTAVANANGGGGGGGGWVLLTAPTVTTTGATITLSGGSAGSASGANPGISGGSGGGFGGTGGSAAIAGSIGQLVVLNIKGVA